MITAAIILGSLVIVGMIIGACLTIWLVATRNYNETIVVANYLDRAVARYTTSSQELAELTSIVAMVERDRTDQPHTVH